jgi:hypothetical protein
MSLVSISTIACSSDPDAANGAPGAASGAQAAPGSAVNIAELEAACNANYDAMIVRFKKCGARSVMGTHPFEESRHSYMKLCSVQGARPGTGYTPAFRTRCADVMAMSACSDDDAIVKACWEPRGDLARGLPCNSDDQCKDGLCVLPTGAASGTSCGVCGVPAWKVIGEKCNQSDKDKCEPASYCSGSAGDEYRTCLDDLGSERAVNTAKLSLGQACVPTASDCVRGTYCALTKTCTLNPGEGQTAGNQNGSSFCDSWTTRSATSTCIVREALSCN